MNGRRRNTGNVHAQDPKRTRLLDWKPPTGSWQPTVPSWEKEFCTSVRSVPWTKLCEAKRFMHSYNKVVEWNDSAGDEAFSNAQERFYAKINDLLCDISLPDPNEYIDEIDWDSAIDPNLLSDLEHEQSTDMEDGLLCDISLPDSDEYIDEIDWDLTNSATDPNLLSDLEHEQFKDTEDGSGRLIFGSVLLSQLFGCMGWGDPEEAFEVCKNFCRVPEFGNSDPNANGTKNSWDNYPPHNNNPSDVKVHIGSGSGFFFVSVFKSNNLQESQGRVWRPGSALRRSS